jgi:hypothetical protein
MLFFVLLPSSPSSCYPKVGQSAEGPVGHDVPKFKTWDEILRSKIRDNDVREEGGGGGRSSSSTSSTTKSSPYKTLRGTRGSPVDMSLYEMLGVQTSASMQEIKGAYRRKALKVRWDQKGA